MMACTPDTLRAFAERHLLLAQDADQSGYEEWMLDHEHAAQLLSDAADLIDEALSMRTNFVEVFEE